mmetsp:Transcript_16589/g.63062  ORF Transcript_16589/g.63062 Transcript_16589/m.63062 type:complete len:331 (-) Transcript_16589:166-1158(-)
MLRSRRWRPSAIAFELILVAKGELALDEARGLPAVTRRLHVHVPPLVGLRRGPAPVVLPSLFLPLCSRVPGNRLEWAPNGLRPQHPGGWWKRHGVHRWRHRSSQLASALHMVVLHSVIRSRRRRTRAGRTIPREAPARRPLHARPVAGQMQMRMLSRWDGIAVVVSLASAWVGRVHLVVPQHRRMRFSLRLLPRLVIFGSLDSVLHVLEKLFRALRLQQKAVVSGQEVVELEDEPRIERVLRLGHGRFSHGKGSPKPDGDLCERVLHQLCVIQPRRYPAHAEAAVRMRLQDLELQRFGIVHFGPKGEGAGFPAARAGTAKGHQAIVTFFR